MSNLSLQLLQRATKIAEQIQKLEAELLSVLGITGAPKAKRGAKKPAVAAAPVAKKRIISPEGRARIIAAQQKRWAKAKKAKKNA